jgi:hypothetical protein
VVVTFADGSTGPEKMLTDQHELTGAQAEAAGSMHWLGRARFALRPIRILPG